jgi:hypothetical protein
MHPGWEGRWPGEGILFPAPPDPHHHKGSHRPLPAPPVPGPAPDWTPPPRRPDPGPPPAWLAAERSGSGVVGPGTDWEWGDDE